MSYVCVSSDVMIGLCEEVKSGTLVYYEECQVTMLKRMTQNRNWWRKWFLLRPLTEGEVHEILLHESRSEEAFLYGGYCNPKQKSSRYLLAEKIEISCRYSDTIYMSANDLTKLKIENDQIKKANGDVFVLHDKDD